MGRMKGRMWTSRNVPLSWRRRRGLQSFGQATSGAWWTCASIASWEVLFWKKNLLRLAGDNVEVHQVRSFFWRCFSPRHALMKQKCSVRIEPAFSTRKRMRLLGMTVVSRWRARCIVKKSTLAGPQMPRKPWSPPAYVKSVRGYPHWHRSDNQCRGQ